jgi:hypothetical protein
LNDPQAVKLGFRLLAEKLMHVDADLAAHPWMRYAIEQFARTSASLRFPTTDIQPPLAVAPAGHSPADLGAPARLIHRWRSEFVHWCMEQAGWQGTYSPEAESWLNWGVGVKPEWGCLVILEGRDGYSIGFHLERRYGREYVLGGYAPSGLGEGIFNVGVAGFGPCYRVMAHRLPRPTS